MTTVDREPSAREQIAEQLASREQFFAPWFLVDSDLMPGTPEANAVLDKAREYDWEAPGRDVDASDEDYADEYLESAMDFLRDLRDNESRMDEEVLGVSVAVTVTLRVDLSTGGPGDYLTAELDLSDGAISDVEYHFAPWYDHAATHVPKSSPLHTVMERYAESYAGQSIADVAGER